MTYNSGYTFARPSAVQVGTVYTPMNVTKKEVAKFQLWVT